MWQRTAFVLPVMIFFIAGSNISYSSDTGTVTRIENKDREEEFVTKRQFRRGIGEELNTLKDKAKQASSVFKWLKRNWQKLFLIFVAIISLLVVVGIYRRCFSDSGSGEDNEQPNVIVIKMPKPDDKEKGATKQANMIEGSSTGDENYGKRGNSSTHGKNSTTGGHKEEATNSKFVEKSASRGRKIPIKSSSVLVTTKRKQHKMDRELTCLQPISLKPDLNEVTSQICALDGIPISGYTTFQQTDYYKLYFHFKQYVINEKNFDDQPNLQLIRVCQGSTSDGPFPFIPLIKNVVTSLMAIYYDAYIPTASTNTELPLTISL